MSDKTAMAIIMGSFILFGVCNIINLIVAFG